MYMRHHLQIWKWDAKGNQYVAMVTKLLSSNCGHLVESYCKDSNTSDANWLRYTFFHYI